MVIFCAAARALSVFCRGVYEVTKRLNMCFHPRFGSRLLPPSVFKASDFPLKTVCYLGLRLTSSSLFHILLIRKERSRKPPAHVFMSNTNALHLHHLSSASCTPQSGYLMELATLQSQPFIARLRSYFSDKDHIQTHYTKNASPLIKYKMARERKFALWRSGVSLLSDVCLCRSF